MKRLLFLVVFTAAFLSSIFAQKPTFQLSTELQAIVDSAKNETLAKFAQKGLKDENLAITLIDLRDPNALKQASFRGNERIYPASVVKLFYLVALHQQLQNGKAKLTPELERGMRDMIVDSSNEATQYILDVITDTSSGAELPPKEFQKWAYKRNAVNRYFTSLGYENINVCQKTFCEDAYGREQQFRDGGKNRNKLNTDATAQLLTQIVLNKAVTPERSKQMMNLLKRDWEASAKDPEDQAHGFTSIALKEMNLKGAKLWSKAGWTSTTRHDAAYIDTPDGLKFVLVVFTENFAAERDILPNVAKVVLRELGKKK